MRKGAQVRVRMTKGADREGKFVGKVSNRGEWYIIKPNEKGAMEFKVRPSMVTPL